MSPLQELIGSDRRKYGIALLLLFVFAIAGLFVPLPGLPEGASAGDPGDIAWMLTAACLVLLMTPGLSFFYGGMVSKKNIISTMLQSFIALGVVTVLYVVVGFSLCFGDSLGGLIGDPRTFFLFRDVGLSTHPELSPAIPLLLFAAFQLKFAIITPALITGSFAERMRFSAYLLFMALFSLAIYCPLAHWTWHPEGFLRQWGVLDFAGGTVVHMSAGYAALVGAWVLGPRLGGTGHAAPANIPYVMLGTGMLWFGWFGFNAGSAGGANATAVLAFGTTAAASASAMMAWIFFDVVRGGKVTALGTCIGAVVGLVAITPAAGFVTVPQALFIGATAAVLSNLAVGAKNRSRLDDTLDVFPCHGVGGIVGMLLTGVFAQEVGLFHGEWSTFLHHLMALAIVSTYCILGSYLLYRATAWLVPLRVAPTEEADGLDRSQHGERYGSRILVEP